MAGAVGARGRPQFVVYRIHCVGQSYAMFNNTIHYMLYICSGFLCIKQYNINNKILIAIDTYIFFII